MKHITPDLLAGAENGSQPGVLSERMRAHLMECCRTCKRAFRDHHLQRISRQQQEWILEPLYKITVAEDIRGRLLALGELSTEEALVWAASPNSCPPQMQTDLALALLLEARKAPVADKMEYWASLAEPFLECHPLPDPEAHLLRTLALTYRAEAARRDSNPLAADQHIRSAMKLAEENKIEDQSTLAELRFIAGKIALRDRREWPTAEEHLSRAGLLYAALGDDDHRAQALIFHACLLRKMEKPSQQNEPLIGAVDMALEALGLVEPKAHAQLFVPILLELAHRYCDQDRFDLAQEVQNQLIRLVPQSPYPPIRGRYRWLMARLANARGEDEEARRQLRACSESVAEPMLDSLGLLLALRDWPSD